MWCQGASYLCGNTLTYSTHYPMTPMQFWPMRVYILLSFVFNNRGFVHRRNIMKQVENKAKSLLIMIENLANKSCSGILNVKTKTFGQTSKRDQIIRSIGKLFSDTVVRNKLAQSDSRVEIANDAIMQFNDARDDFVVMARCSAMIDDKYPVKKRMTAGEKALQALAE